MPFQPSPYSISQSPYVDAHFGGNFLAVDDRIGENGTFDEAVEALGLTALRYPGGALTEQNLGILTPQTEQIIDRDTGEPIKFTPVSEFNSYADAEGLAVTYVIPTRVFIGEDADANGDRFADIDEDAIRNFITEVADGSMGATPEVKAIEIGNEYWGSGEMSAVEYGRVASEMSTIIDDEISSLTSGNRLEDTDIAVQMGLNYGSSNLSDVDGDTGAEQLATINETYGLDLSEDKFIYASGDVAWAKVNNEIILNEFDNSEREAITGVIAHIYSKGEDRPNSRYYELSQIEDTWRQDNPQLEVYATEWNLKRTVDETRQEEYGLKQAHEMLNIMEAFAWYDVDAAHVWPVQMDSRVGLTGNEGSETVDLPGEMFRLMNDTLPGTRPIDLTGSQNTESEVQGETADVHAFYAEDKFVTFLASNTDDPSEEVVDFTNLVTDCEDISITRLGVEEGSNPTASASAPVVTDESESNLIEDGILIADMAPREILVIEMTNPTYSSEMQSVVAAANDADDGDIPAVPPDESDTPDDDDDSPPEDEAGDGGGGIGGLGALLALAALPLLLLGG